MSNKTTQKFAAKGSKTVKAVESTKGKVNSVSQAKTSPKNATKAIGQRALNSVRDRFVRGGWIWALAIISVVVIISFSARTSGEYSRLNLFEIELDGISTVQTGTDFIKQNLPELTAEQVTIVGGNKMTFRALASADYIDGFNGKFAENPAVLASRAYRVSPSTAFNLDLTNFAIGMGLYLAGAAFVTLLFMRKESLLLRAKIVVTLTGLPLLAGLVLVALGVILSQLGLVTYNPHTYEVLTAGVAVAAMVTLFMVFYPETRRKLLSYIF